MEITAPLPITSADTVIINLALRLLNFMAVELKNGRPVLKP